MVELAKSNPSWLPGVSQNPSGRESAAARRARIEKIVAAWAGPFGGVDALLPAELVLAHTAAELSLYRPRRHEDAVRQANAISKLLAQAGLACRHEKPREACTVRPRGLRPLGRRSRAQGHGRTRRTRRYGGRPWRLSIPTGPRSRIANMSNGGLLLSRLGRMAARMTCPRRSLPWIAGLRSAARLLSRRNVSSWRFGLWS